MDTAAAGGSEGLIQTPKKNYLEMQLVVSFTKLCQEGKKALKQRGETTDEAKTCILGSRPD